MSMNPVHLSARALILSLLGMTAGAGCSADKSGDEGNNDPISTGGATTTGGAPASGVGGQVGTTGGQATGGSKVGTGGSATGGASTGGASSSTGGTALVTGGKSG